MQDFEQWLQHHGKCRNTSSAYLRSLKALFNRAVDAGLTTERNPFRRVFTGNAHTVKRGLSRSEFNRLLACDTDNDRQRVAVDIFLFSVTVCGMWPISSGVRSRTTVSSTAAARRVSACQSTWNPRPRRSSAATRVGEPTAMSSHFLQRPTTKKPTAMPCRAITVAFAVGERRPACSAILLRMWLVIHGPVRPMRTTSLYPSSPRGLPIPTFVQPPIILPHFPPVVLTKVTAV